MAKKLKEGVELTPWGPGNGKVTSESSLNEAGWEYLAEKFPDAFEDEKPKKEKAEKGKAE